MKCFANKKLGQKCLLDVAILVYWAQTLLHSLLAQHTDRTHPAVMDRLGSIPNCTSIKFGLNTTGQLKERQCPKKTVGRKGHEKGKWSLATWSIYWRKTKTQIMLALSETTTVCHLASVLQGHPWRTHSSAVLLRWGTVNYCLHFPDRIGLTHAKKAPFSQWTCV